MNTIDARVKYRELLNDLDFEKLGMELGKPSIFQILNASRTEIRHSNFLAWLLDPNANHGLGKLLLTKILRDIIFTSEIETGIDEFEIENLNFSSVEIRREWKNIDLLIIFENLVVCIENKVDSKDHSNQLKKYRETVKHIFPQEHKLFVYLTPAGEEPTTKEELNYYTLFSYENIGQILEATLDIHGESLNPAIYIYIEDYLKTIRRELMQNDTPNILADKIYKNHKELLDFIFEHKSDLSLELYPIFEQKITDSGWIMGSKNKGFARFTTPILKKITPNKGTGWSQKESFLFEIDYFWNVKKATFKTVISPTDHQIKEIFQKALENLNEVQGYKSPRGNKWIVHFNYSWKFDNNELEVADEQTILENLSKNWEKITSIVTAVEKELLKHESELQQYIN